jgi:hypothetical protein
MRLRGARTRQAASLTIHNVTTPTTNPTCYGNPKHVRPLLRAKKERRETNSLVHVQLQLPRAIR